MSPNIEYQVSPHQKIGCFLAFLGTKSFYAPAPSQWHQIWSYDVPFETITSMVIMAPIIWGLQCEFFALDFFQR